MGARGWILVAALLGASGVGLGAFQAHGLERMLDSQDVDVLSKQKRMENCETAVRYQMLHAPAILVIACFLMSLRSRLLHSVAGLWLIGIMGFAGPLYLYSMAGSKQLIHVVPIGGLTLIVGWLLLGVAAFIVRLPPHRADDA